MEIKKTIEAWQIEKKTEPFVFEGVKAYNNLAAGKELTEQEYETAVHNFLYGEPVLCQPVEKAVDEEKPVKSRKGRGDTANGENTI